ncbi:hypothetical protein LJC64_01150 [Ruminococcaceae bacterium OttesenSCG-928-A11]|nr:hypothetical protein [Ruminococcaceae bacterium OttesenSCG-928-A11]
MYYRLLFVIFFSCWYVFPRRGRSHRARRFIGFIVALNLQFGKPTILGQGDILFNAL